MNDILTNLSLQDIPGEEWKDVIGYEGIYQVSNMGRIKAIGRWELNHRNNNYKYWKSPRILKIQKCSNGYTFLNLFKNKIHKPLLVHRLVATAFIPNPENKREVNHKNGIITDNRVENLEWVTPKENTRHAFKFLGRQRPKGENNCNSTLTDIQAWNIYNETGRNVDIAKKYNTTLKIVQSIRYNERWQSVIARFKAEQNIS